MPTSKDTSAELFPLPPGIERVAVLGGGSWATALVKILSEKNLKVKWWLRKEEDVAFINAHGHNPRYLSNTALDLRRVKPTSSLPKALKEADVVILAIPAAFLTEALASLPQGALTGKKVLSAIKGLVPQLHIPVTDWLQQHYGLPADDLAIIAGPCHAEEVAMERLSYLTLAGTSPSTNQAMAQLLRCGYIRTSTCEDLYGVEYCAVLKNVVALTAGICHGLGYGDNFQAVLVSNALQEMARFLSARFPAERDLSRSAYLGDLLVTAYSQFSRNRTFGNMIGRGYTVQSAQVEMNMVAEGYYAVRSLYESDPELASGLPILKAVYQILYRQAPVRKEIEVLSQQFV